MKVYIQVKMWKGLVDEVEAYEEKPPVLDTSDEHWDNGIKTFVTRVKPKFEGTLVSSCEDSNNFSGGVH